MLKLYRRIFRLHRDNLLHFSYKIKISQFFSSISFEFVLFVGTFSFRSINKSQFYCLHFSTDKVYLTKHCSFVQRRYFMTGKKAFLSNIFCKSVSQ